GVAAAMVVVLVAAVMVAGRHGGTNAMPRLPVLGPAHDVYDGDLGDPFVLPVNAGGKIVRFVAFGTGDWPSRVPTARSTDLAAWQDGPDALPQLPTWAAEDPKNSLSWAPAALDTGHGYVLYITLPDAASGQQCIAAASSPVAEGPYTAVGDGPLLCQHDLGGSIDPAVVRDRAGKLHMLWKNDGNSVKVLSSLWEQGLTADGLGLTGTPHRLLTASLPWQGDIIEEPAVIPAAGGGWWLFYSGNFFDKPEYATGLAYCPTLEGPCREAAVDPFLATAALQQEKQSAPGGLETFLDGKGALWAVFDTWNRPTRNGRFYCCRSLQLAQILSH
ncbi:MAG: glycoside hydrolase family 43 protein, partial [Actinomycetota bacterium]|nr:glycoside hydrolase family 43 protein [Actinomycetota bacterium]